MLSFFSFFNRLGTNEMIKDGYHVDEAYLYEYSPGSSSYREIDVLRIFRQQIQLQTFTNTKSCDLVDFIAACCDPQSNFTEWDNEASYELLVSYTFDHQKYKIVYGSRTETIRVVNGATIRFPLYTERAIRTKNLRQTGGLTDAMLMMDENGSEDSGINIYIPLKELAGPMGNFYTDTEFSVKKHYLQYTGLRAQIDQMYIKMFDLWGTEFILRPEQEIIKLEI